MGVFLATDGKAHGGPRKAYRVGQRQPNGSMVGGG